MTTTPIPAAATAITELRHYLHARAAVTSRIGPRTDTWVHPSPEHVYLHHGQPAFTRRGDALPGPYAAGAPGRCFDNAYQLAEQHPELDYVTGFATSGFLPVEHAWCQTSGGAVIDPTWATLSFGDDLHYLGVTISSSFLHHCAVTIGYADPVHNDWRTGHRGLRHGYISDPVTGALNGWAGAHTSGRSGPSSGAM